MIVMHPIAEQDVIDQLRAQRFCAEIDGYVVMDESEQGAEYLGYMLYQVEGKLTTLLCCDIAQTPLIDGAVRACVAAGENAGAIHFCWNTNDASLVKWGSVFCKNEKMPVSNDKIFHECK